MGKWWKYWRKKNHIPKARVESYPYIDSAELYDKRRGKEGDREGILCSQKVQLFKSRILAALPSESENFYEIPVVTTLCHYGNERHWFVCTSVKCNRKCKKLYLSKHRVFLCRKCLNLAYVAQNRSKLDRIIDRKWKIVAQLHADTDFITKKPKGMHQKTFDRIRDEISRLDNLAEEGILEHLETSNPWAI